MSVAKPSTSKPNENTNVDLLATGLLRISNPIIAQRVRKIARKVRDFSEFIRQIENHTAIESFCKLCYMAPGSFHNANQIKTSRQPGGAFALRLTNKIVATCNASMLAISPIRSAWVWTGENKEDSGQ